MDDLVKGLLEAPSSMLDAAIKPHILAWSEPPTSLQVLKVLDICVHDGLASGFTVRLLNVMFEMAMAREGTTRDVVIAQAPWRNNDNEIL